MGESGPTCSRQTSFCLFPPLRNAHVVLKGGAAGPYAGSGSGFPFRAADGERPVQRLKA